MLQATNSNRNRQEEEMLVLSSIYNCNEFSYNKEDTIQCYYNVFSIVHNLLRLENIYEDSDFHSFSKYIIKYVPPIRVYVQLPADYPIEKPPNFYIISSWLSPWQLSFICQKLDEIWLMNKGQEILFIWFEFLKHDLFDFLKIKHTLDISLMHLAYYNLIDYFKLIWIVKSDDRAISNAFSSPIKFLINYDKYQQKIMFQYNCYLCIICLSKYYGKDCIKLKNCNHVYCKKCIQEYITIKINENNVNDITCPDLSCNYNITFNEVKELCPELFTKYENLLLRFTLNSMKDLVFCPRNSCQCPLVINNYDDTLAICSKCDHTFCTYCYKLYHGVAPCAMTTDDTAKLIREYEQGNNDEKKLLEKKYGRKQIQRVVDKYLTDRYLKTHRVKACPNCSTMISKTTGCNKITCVYCKIHFCWLCGIQITTADAYDHFTTPTSCYKRLFEGIEDVEP
ncbi:E3 ubiquitin-protein ligase RNF14-like [Xylocopa sonorina]|uniref:E3 ubiquitin-protein ligase RNF14-like n=1 Tax=Xylocopa sonorina TaxID=1818115 RepID=UPI00403A9AE2